MFRECDVTLSYDCVCAWNIPRLWSVALKLAVVFHHGGHFTHHPVDMRRPRGLALVSTVDGYQMRCEAPDISAFEYDIRGEVDVRSEFGVSDHGISKLKGHQTVHPCMVKIIINARHQHALSFDTLEQILLQLGLVEQQLGLWVLVVSDIRIMCRSPWFQEVLGQLSQISLQNFPRSCFRPIVDSQLVQVQHPFQSICGTHPIQNTSLHPGSSLFVFLWKFDESDRDFSRHFVRNADNLRLRDGYMRLILMWQSGSLTSMPVPSDITASTASQAMFIPPRMIMSAPASAPGVDVSL